VTRVVWDPEDRKPAEAEALESQIREIAPDAQVKITLHGNEWVVRALRPAALCTRGAGFDGRDVSRTVADLLRAEGLPVRV
jgi:hypothetical protein